MPKEFDPAVSRFVRELLPSRLPVDKSVKEQAGLIGVSDATLSEVLRDQKGVGRGTLPRFARFLGLSVDELVRKARAAQPQVPAHAPTAGRDGGEVVVDTLSMAEEAVRDLVEIDRLKEQRAWQLVRGIKLNKPTARGFYREARRRLAAAEGSSKGPRSHEAELDRPPGPPVKPKPKR